MEKILFNSPDIIKSLPGLDKMNEIQFSGYASIYGSENKKQDDSDNEELFYWFVGTQDYASKPTVIWTNGGPGSSSFWGFFLENGPYEIVQTEDGTKLTARDSAWNNYANYMIFEHPLSVTLSFSKDNDHIPENAPEGIKQYYQALLNFIDIHPEVAKNPVILAGESYAGTYLTLLSKSILDGNKKSGNVSLDLKSTVLLDAWVDPEVQMKSDTEYAYYHGLISRQQKNKIDLDYKNNLPGINMEIQKICGLYMANIAESGDPCFQPVLDYINRSDVRKAIHAKQDTLITQSWSKMVADNYASTVNNSYSDMVLEILKENVKVIVISGLNDAKDCNFIGTESWLYLLDDDVVKDFHEAETRQWKKGDNSPVLGYIQEGSLLSWVKVLNAGHLAVMDQPHLIQLILGMSEK